MFFWSYLTVKEVSDEHKPWNISHCNYIYSSAFILWPVYPCVNLLVAVVGHLKNISQPSSLKFGAEFGHKLRGTWLLKKKTTFQIVSEECFLRSQVLGLIAKSSNLDPVLNLLTESESYRIPCRSYLDYLLTKVRNNYNSGATSAPNTEAPDVEVLSWWA